jgi:hypothetical protein
VTRLHIRRSLRRILIVRHKPRLPLLRKDACVFAGESRQHAVRMTQHYTHVSEQATIIAMRQASQGAIRLVGRRPVVPVPATPVLYENNAVMDGSIVGKSARRSLLQASHPRMLTPAHASAAGT